MFLLAALFLSLALASTSITPISDGNNEQREQAHAQWVQGVENVLSNILLGPLRPEFTPAFLNSRKREDIINSQRTYFRAYVARILMQSLAPDGLVHVEPPAEVSPEVVEAQVQELKQHSFSVRWVGQGVGGPFVVNVPRTSEK
jgi:hypothetical protein